MPTIQKINNVPKDRDVLLIADTYDCGWVIDSGHWDSSLEEFVVSYVNPDKRKTHLPYSHWIDAPKDGWKPLTMPVEDKVLILAEINSSNEIENFCTGWWYDKENSWVATGTLRSEKIQISTFTHYMELDKFSKEMKLHLLDQNNV